MNWYKKAQWVKKPNQWSWEMFLKGIALGMFGTFALEFLAVNKWNDIKGVYEKTKNLFTQNPAAAAQVAEQSFEDIAITQQNAGEDIVVDPNMVEPTSDLVDPNMVELESPDQNSNSELEQMIERHEGKRNSVYRDTKGIPTIGIGFNLLRGDAREKIESLGLNYNDVVSGTQQLTDDQIYSLFREDVNQASQDARSFISNFDEQPTHIQNVLIDMAFNMGSETLSQFKNFKKDIENKNYQSAAKRMTKSKWYKQVGNRSRELTKIVRNTVKSFLTMNWYKKSSHDKIKEFEDHWKEILGLGEYAPEAAEWEKKRQKNKKKSRDFQHSMDINEDQEDDGW